jgi:hypothetical protein
MKKLQKINIWAAFIFFAALLISQQAIASKKLHIQTDKILYVSGENIWFKCTGINISKKESSILFVDLSGENYIISSRIFERKNDQWHGEIPIPDSLQTGVYLLRTYTGDINGNLSISAFPIQVINRFGNNGINEGRKTNKTYNAFHSIMKTHINTGNELTLKSNKKKYKKGETAIFNIENLLDETIGEISFSIFKTDDLNDNIPVLSEKNYKLFKNDEEIKIYNQLTVTGKLLDENSNEPASNELVILSIPDTVPQIHYSKTNNDGSFLFILNKYTGKQTAIVQAINKNKKFEIIVNPTTLLPPETIPFYIDQKFENSNFSALAVKRASIHKAYTIDSLEELKSDNIYRYPFYGLTHRKVYPSKYVDLNDFKEIAWEILPSLKYRSDKDSTYLRIWDANSKMFFENPYILVDGVPVFSPADINVLKSTDIRYIEFQAQARCYGDLFIDGLVAIFTYSADFSKIKQPVNSIEINFETFCLNDQNLVNKPFFRDNLYWDPWLNSKKKNHQIEVAISLETGTYTAICQTHKKTGELQKSVIQIQIE